MPTSDAPPTDAKNHSAAGVDPTATAATPPGSQGFVSQVGAPPPSTGNFSRVTLDTLIGVVGLAFTLWTFTRVGRLQKDMYARVLAPRIIGRVRGHLKNLEGHLRRKAGSAKFEKELSQCREQLLSLKAALPRQGRSRTSESIEFIDAQLRLTAITPEGVEKIMANVEGCVTAADNILEAQTWTPNA